MIRNEIDELIAEIFLGNLKDKETVIVDLLTKIMVSGVSDEIRFLEIIKKINEEIQVKNFSYIVDILEFEIKKILVE